MSDRGDRLGNSFADFLWIHRYYLWKVIRLFRVLHRMKRAAPVRQGRMDDGADCRGAGRGTFNNPARPW
jgi:hypothetical protein